MRDVLKLREILGADMSEFCIEDILQRIGDFLFEKAEEDAKMINFEKERIAKQVNNMMKSGDTDKVRQTSTGEIVGDPEVVKKLNDLKAKLRKNGK